MFEEVIATQHCPWSLPVTASHCIPLSAAAAAVSIQCHFNRFCLTYAMTVKNAKRPGQMSLC